MGIQIKQYLLFLVLLAPCGASFVSTRSALARTTRFVSPRLEMASDIAYPLNSTASGIVTFAVDLDASGQVQNLQVLRDIPSLTDPAMTAIQRWTFAPGKLGGSPVPSSLSVSVLFNPAILRTHNLSVLPVQPAPPPNPPGYLPPEISVASYARYPPASVATGTVVLNIIVGEANQVQKVSTIRDIPSLTSPATTTVRNWSFNSGTFHGRAIASTLVIAVVFRSPNALQ